MSGQNNHLDYDINIEFEETDEARFAPPAQIKKSFSSHLLFNTGIESHCSIKAEGSSRYSSTSSLFIGAHEEPSNYDQESDF